MLDTKTFDAMAVYWRNLGRTFCWSMEEAKQFCWRMKLKEDDIEIYQSRGRFVIELANTATA